MATTEHNIFLNPAELATEIRAVMEADNQLHREELAKRIATKMLEAARQPAPPPEVITRFAGIDGRGIESRLDALGAIDRRLNQIKGIAALLGMADRIFHDVPDHAFNNASWALQDLAEETEELVRILGKMPADDPPKQLSAI
ncbi:hypothetical protein CGK74_14930 [Thauera propionica]|uniref:Uncharacterized protein n=1 Tax=Thauera propionica TaxID=2019431 RepID=A0A235EWS4_9RHOO|nr:MULTISPECIES: hypothetical protein [Thauera]OYD52997.1 hypothetical protein CGK74_14930 [Thauera propionica]